MPSVTSNRPQFQPHNSSRSKEDPELWIRLNRGDPCAEAEVVTQYGGALKSTLTRRAYDRSAVPDLYQETFVRFFSRLRKRGLHQPEKALHFLQRIAVNVCLEDNRRYQSSISSPAFDADQQPDFNESPVSSASRNSVRKALFLCLSQLKAVRDKEILLRYYFLEQEKSTICAELDLSVAHFDRVIYRAKHRLSVEMAKQDLGVDLLFA